MCIIERGEKHASWQQQNKKKKKKLFYYRWMKDELNKFIHRKFYFILLLIVCCCCLRMNEIIFYEWRRQQHSIVVEWCKILRMNKFEKVKKVKWEYTAEVCLQPVSFNFWGYFFHFFFIVLLILKNSCHWINFQWKIKNKYKIWEVILSFLNTIIIFISDEHFRSFLDACIYKCIAVECKISSAQKSREKLFGAWMSRFENKFCCFERERCVVKYDSSFICSLPSFIIVVFFFTAVRFTSFRFWPNIFKNITIIGHDNKIIKLSQEKCRYNMWMWL